MNKIISLARISKKINMPFLSEVSMIMDQEKRLRGFVFGRDSFISLLERFDSEFEEKVSDQEKAYTNSAGKLIDHIESFLEIRPEFLKQLKKARSEAKKQPGISLNELIRELHV